MFLFLSKFIPLLIYPLGFVSLLLLVISVSRRTPRLIRILSSVSFLILFISGNRWASVSLARTLEWHYLPSNISKADAIIVLGGATDPAQSPRPMVEVNSAADRIFYASQLYHDGKAPLILVSGGNIEWAPSQNSTPASEMASLLEMLGVPGSAILQQDRSQNTYEDAKYSTEILHQKGIYQALLVTSALHMPRSMALFEKQGMKVNPAPADFTVTQENWKDLWQPNLETFLINLVPSISSLGLTTNAFKEYLGMFVYHLQGWL